MYILFITNYLNYQKIIIMKRTVVFWGFVGVFALLATGVYLKNSELRGESDFLLANVEALTESEKPDPPKMGYVIVSFVTQPPCYVAFPGLKPNDPPQLVKGKTPVCNYVAGGELAGCPSCMIG